MYRSFNAKSTENFPCILHNWCESLLQVFKLFFFSPQLKHKGRNGLKDYLWRIKSEVIGKKIRSECFSNVKANLLHSAGRLRSAKVHRLMKGMMQKTILCKYLSSNLRATRRWVGLVGVIITSLSRNISIRVYALFTISNHFCKNHYLVKVRRFLLTVKSILTYLSTLEWSIGKIRIKTGRDKKIWRKNEFSFA